MDYKVCFSKEVLRLFIILTQDELLFLGICFDFDENEIPKLADT